MWEVQTMGYQKGSVLSAGLVNRGAGYTDSPDAEFISEGDHAKAPGQVALGRHGNIFHWGYSGGPKHMTAQGKLVFINAIHYIAQFKGQRILSKKLHDRMWLRDRVKGYASKDFKAAYIAYKKSIKARNIQSEKNRKAAKKKQAEGKELTEREKMRINSQPLMILSEDEYYRSREPKLYDKFGLDYKNYNNFYKRYIPFMRADPDFLFNFIIDEDAMKFGKSFYDEDFLPVCIAALKDETKKGIALLLLKRYTNEVFDSAKEWEKWYEKNREYLFFTETGGCKYLINKIKKELK